MNENPLKKYIESWPKWFTIVLIHLIYYFLYFITNHFPIYEPSTLPLLFGEEKIPYLMFGNITVWIYFSVNLQTALLLILIPKKQYWHIISIFSLLYLTHILIFLIFPTAYPRIGIVSNETGYFVFDMLRKVDTCNSAFPSLHISMTCFAAAVVFYFRKYWIGTLYVLYALLVSSSVLLTKQHYVLDVVGGITVALIAAFFLFKNRKK